MHVTVRAAAVVAVCAPCLVSFATRCRPHLGCERRYLPLMAGRPPSGRPPAPVARQTDGAAYSRSTGIGDTLGKLDSVALVAGFRKDHGGQAEPHSDSRGSAGGGRSISVVVRKRPISPKELAAKDWDAVRARWCGVEETHNTTPQTNPPPPPGYVPQPPRRDSRAQDKVRWNHTVPGEHAVPI